MMFDASTLISDSRLAFLQGQYEVSLTLAKDQQSCSYYR